MSTYSCANCANLKTRTLDRSSLKCHDDSACAVIPCVHLEPWHGSKIPSHIGNASRGSADQQSRDVKGVRGPYHFVIFGRPRRADHRRHADHRRACPDDTASRRRVLRSDRLVFDRRQRRTAARTGAQLRFIGDFPGFGGRARRLSRTAGTLYDLGRRRHCRRSAEALRLR